MGKASEYRDQSVEQLEAAHQDLAKKLYHLKCERLSSGEVDKPHELRSTRKEIARILTVINEKKRG